MSTISLNHYTMVCFKQTCNTREMQAIAKETDGWIIRSGERCVMQTKAICPGVYHVWFDREKS